MYRTMLARSEGSNQTLNSSLKALLVQFALAPMAGPSESSLTMAKTCGMQLE